MGTSVWGFKVRRIPGYGEAPEPRFVASPPSETGRERVLVLDSTEARMVVSGGVVILDGTDGHAPSDWNTFYKTTISYGATSFLFKLRTATYREISGESIGTVAGGGSETFTLARKFVHHTDFSETSSSLVVRVGSTIQTLTTDYTVSLNGTTPTITSTAAMDTGAATADYEYYYQVRGSLGRMTPRILRYCRTLTNEGAQLIPFGLREVVPGGSLA